MSRAGFPGRFAQPCLRNQTPAAADEVQPMRQRSKRVPAHERNGHDQDRSCALLFLPPILVFRGRGQATICSSKKINSLFRDVHALATGVGRMGIVLVCVDCRLKSGWHPRPSIVLSLRAGLSRHSMTSRSYLKLRAWPLPNMNGQCDQATTRDCLIIDAVLTADESIHRSCRPVIVGERRKQGEYAAL